MTRLHMNAFERDSILLVLPVPFRRAAGGELLFEAQACNGLDLWARHFRKVIVAAPLDAGTHTRRGPGSTSTYLPVAHIGAHERIECVPLPWAYQTRTFIPTLPATRRLLALQIARSEYLCFAVGGLIGDWASVAALEAISQRRAFAVWTDRVEHAVTCREHLDFAGLRRAYQWTRNRLFRSPLMFRLERYIIQRAALGLFHGRDTYDFYARWNGSPHLVHDIHLKAEDRITPDALAAKIARLRRHEPLRIAYAGRVVAMKGPFDWIRVLARLREAGVAFRAQWLGDGPLLEDARAEVQRLGLGAAVSFPGHVSDRATLLDHLRDADMFLFCHHTPESPRCLIESLMAGTPLLGYDSPYPRDLLQGDGEAMLAPRGDADALAKRVIRLHADREALARSIERAAALGGDYCDEVVFQHRADLIKRCLPRACKSEPGGQLRLLHLARSRIYPPARQHEAE